MAKLSTGQLTLAIAALVLVGAFLMGLQGGGPSTSGALVAGCALTNNGVEACDGKDNNCDGRIDEGVKKTFYKDVDGDSYGYTNLQACSAPAGYVTKGGDCKDGNAAVNPGATEACDGVDNNCNSKIDEGCASTCTDPDGVNDKKKGTCTDPSSSYTDYCDTSGAVVEYYCQTNVYPQVCKTYATKNPNSDMYACSDGAWTCKSNAEICDGKDNNCNGQIDETVKTAYLQDADGDGYGNFNKMQYACSTPSGYVELSKGTDCNDNDANAHPNASEICGNGIDEDCSGTDQPC
jgi:hypothetical protein